MRRSRVLLTVPLVVAAVASSLGATPMTATATAAQPVTPTAASYRATPLWFTVDVGPGDATSCGIDATLYEPADASAAHPVPAILATNGFGGSQADFASYGPTYAKRGYAFLAYSGLGFGDSSCPISLDDPSHDGKAAQQLVSYLGGETGHAFLDSARTQPAPALTDVVHDGRDHLGQVSVHDPRVGMVGGSYGGGAQFAAASVDPRIDTLVPIITWSDLSYSLAPNNTTQGPAATSVSSTVTGSAKTNWALGFSALGIAGGVQHAQTDPSRLIGCPNFQSWVCPALAMAGSTGTIDAHTRALLHDRSVAAFTRKIKVPSLFIQGEGDTLFNLNEAVATYTALRRQGTTAKMIWANGGHSEAFLPGEIDDSHINVRTQYLSGRIADWFDHYLKGSDVGTGPQFAYFRDWVHFQGNARPAYAAAPAYPLPGSRTLYLSRSALVTKQSAVKAGTSRFVTPPAGAPTSFDPLDVVGSAVPVALPESDAPGTSASFTTAPLSSTLDVAGIPEVRLQVSAPVSQVTGTAGAVGSLALFLKVLDVDPSGTATLVRNLVAPVRVTDVTQPFTVRLPGFVHRFAAGHQLRLVVAGGSTNYRGGAVPTPVTITTGGAGQTLTLPLAK